MNKSRLIRLGVFAALILLSCVWFLRTGRAPADVTLLVTFVICVVTTIYAVLTFEILVENQAMARATKDSANLMEKSLRFPSSAHLTFRTIGTKNLDISQLLPGVLPFRNGDFSTALELAQGGNSDADFVFAVVENKGPGTATKLSIEATYSIVDSGSMNKNANVTRTAKVPILAAGTGIALCVFMSRLPTVGDGATLISANLINSDFYRDAIGDPVQTSSVEVVDHQSECVAGSTLKVG